MIYAIPRFETMTLKTISSSIAAAVTETTTKTAAGVSVGAEVVSQVKQGAGVVIETGLTDISTTIAIVAGVVAIVSGVMNYRLNAVRLKMEKAEHLARMRRLEGPPKPPKR